MSCGWLKFSPTRKTKLVIAEMCKNADDIWVFAVSKFCAALLDAERILAMFATALRIVMRAMADGVWGRVHAPLSGVSAFSVALV
jgi:hypothetical protein